MGATSTGTQSYFARHPLTTPALTLGLTGWKVSPIGFGGYRVDVEVDEHRDALMQALGSGCNLIDTSSNYTDGHSERLVGEVLSEMVSKKEITREEIVLVTKVGYVQGENLVLAQQRKERGIPFPEMVQYSDDCWHCISPEFLKDQINRSLSRLGTSQIDVLLLHNPEYFLKTTDDHAEYYRRIRVAFEYLEKEVASKRIQFYGISSNTFPGEKTDRDFTSLEVVLEQAKEIGAKHFGVIQFPFNLYEPDAAFHPLLEQAAQAKLGTLINRPLNAFYGNKLLRLADFPSHPDKDVEDSLKESFLTALQTESDYQAKDLIPAKEIAWAHILQQNFEKIHDLESWKNILAYQIGPAMDRAQEVLTRHSEHKEWLEAYLTDSEALFKDITDYLEETTSALSRKISRLLDITCPELKTSTTLSQKALRVYRSFPQIHCVLVGMRKPAYVKDAMTFQPPLSEEKALNVLRAIQHDIEEGAQ
jgi:aryl-alcohol dehydrogenase-like predicted oxidoreductase